MNEFDRWVNDCANDNDIKLVCIEGKGRTALYQTRQKHKDRGEWNILFRPVYHVWIDGVCVIHTADSSTAYREWGKRPRIVYGKEKRH